MLFEFQSGSHLLNLQLIFFFYFKDRAASLRYTWISNFFFIFKIICRFGDIRVQRAKTKLGHLEKKNFEIFFPIEFFFCHLPQVSKHSMSWPDSKVTLILQEKIAKFELSHRKKFR